MSERKRPYPSKEERPEEIINVMPDKETLEEFIKGMHGPVTVYFDKEKGEFIWLTERPNR